MSRSGRNDPCPCGSGKKYKKCCMPADRPPVPLPHPNETVADVALGWISAHHEDALQEAFDEFMARAFRGGESPAIPEEFGQMVEINAGEWMLSEATMGSGRERRSFNRLLLEPGGPSLSREQRDWIAAIGSSPLRLYEVVGVRPGEGLELLDALVPEGEAVFVNEVMGSRTARVGIYLGARVVPLGERKVLSGAIYAFRADQGLRLADALEARIAGLRPDSAERRSAIARMIRDEWIDVVLGAPALPKMIDAATGSPFLITHDHYEVIDRPALEAALAAQPDLDGGWGEGWSRSDRDESDGPRRVLCFLLPDDRKGRLKIATRSIEAADRAREWFDPIAGAAVRHLARDTETAEGMLARSEEIRSRRDRPGPRSTEIEQIAPERMSELREQIMRKIYRDWASTPIPVLGDRTPLEAIESPQGRAKVLRLLRTYEQGERDSARKEGRAPVDLGFLYMQIGLDPEQGGGGG